MSVHNARICCIERAQIIVNQPTLIGSIATLVGRTVTSFALCYGTFVLCCLSVCNVSVLWPNGWMDQDATWYGGRPRSRRHCVRLGPSSPPTERGTAAPSTFRPISIVANRSPIPATAELLFSNPRDLGEISIGMAVVTTCWAQSGRRSDCRDIPKGEVEATVPVAE